jgi:hypothetical protein
MTPQALNDLRSRVLAGETVPAEELAQALSALRGNRTSASASSTASRKKNAKQTPEEALAELDSLLGDAL